MELKIVKFKDKRKQCKFKNSCGLFNETSFTCTHTGGSYCGKYRKLKEETNRATEIPA